MKKIESIDASTADILSGDFIHHTAEDVFSDLEFSHLDDVVYNSASSFDITEIADLLLDNVDQCIFITDSVTKNIVYLNKPMQEALGVDGSFVGTCYSLLRGCDEPCKECKANKSINGKFYITSHETSKLNNTQYVIKSKTIELYNRNYTLNILIQKTTKINKDDSVKAGKSINDLVAPYVEIYANNAKNPDVQIYRIIENLGYDTKSDFCALYEHYNFNDQSEHEDDDNKTDINLKLHRSHIWMSDDSLDINQIYHVPQKFLDLALTEQKQTVYEDPESNASYSAIPLVFDEKYLGTIFLKNPINCKLDILKPAFSTIIKLTASAVAHRRMCAQLSNVTNKDALTGLKNRISLLKDVNTLSLSDDIGVIFMNVNGLKQINTNLGIKEGDAILVKTASLLQQLLHDSEYIYRIGGDEFIGITTAISEHDFAVLADMLKAFMTNEKGFSVSVGSHWIHSGMSIMAALNKAESDMYTEKKNYYRLHRNDNIAERYRSENDKLLNIIEPARIQELIAGNCFKVLYQPKFRIQGEKAEIAGAEALVRLYINGSIVPPDDFIPALEAAHYTHLIDYFVFETICKRMRERLDSNKPILPISCNFSRHTIVRPEFKTKLKEIMNKYHIAYDMIPLEVSEHTNTNRHKELVAVTDNLSNEGFNISIDDFGTAHANIYTLADLSVSEVKFDKKLIDNLACKNNKKITTILSVLITMCKRLGIKTIAEGVEDKDQNDILKSLGCDEIQGYYYSKPIQDEEFYNKLDYCIN